jgi:hypothetical protein
MLHISAIFILNTPSDSSLSHRTQTHPRDLDLSLKQSSLSSSLVLMSTEDNIEAERFLETGVTMSSFFHCRVSGNVVRISPYEWL